MFWTNFWQSIMYNKIFFKKLLSKIVCQIFTLLLVHIASKSVIYSRHGESLKNTWKSTNHHIRKVMLPFPNSSECLNTHCVSTYWPITTQSCQRNRKYASTSNAWITMYLILDSVSWCMIMYQKFRTCDIQFWWI